MKHDFYGGSLLMLLLFLMAFSHASARLLQIKQGEKSVDLDGSSKRSIADIEGSVSDSLNEDCGNGNGDEECLNRRIVADDEAHLDYIYTQHLKH